MDAVKSGDSEADTCEFASQCTDSGELGNSQMVLVHASKQFVLVPEGTLVGRGDDCSVLISGSNVSRHHAEIKAFERRWFLRDLNSLNGTTLQEVPLLPNHWYRIPTAGNSVSICIGGIAVHFTRAKPEVVPKISKRQHTKSAKSQAKKVPRREVPTTHELQHSVIVTTGVRLKEKEKRGLSRAGVHPSCDPKGCTLLVAHAPIVRSIKLVVALATAKRMVNEQWIFDCLSQQATVDTGNEKYEYTEDGCGKAHQMRHAIETTNGFTFDEFFTIPPSQRAVLFAGATFSLWSNVEPQDPPLNDIRDVLTAYGGTVASMSAATTVVLAMPDDVEEVRERLKRKRMFPFVVTIDAVLKSALKQRIVW